MLTLTGPDSFTIVCRELLSARLKGGLKHVQHVRPNGGRPPQKYIVSETIALEKPDVQLIRISINNLHKNYTPLFPTHSNGTNSVLNETRFLHGFSKYTLDADQAYTDSQFL